MPPAIRLNRIIAILLLSVHFFTVCGYQLFFSLAENIADRQIVASLDANNYDESELVQIRLPLNIPYTTNWKDYERCDGNILLNGIHYNYVKRIVYNDTMYLYCIPNQQKTGLNHTKNEFARQLTDLPSNHKGDQPTTKKVNLADEYNTENCHYNFSTTVNGTRRFFFLNNDKLAPGFLFKPTQPPELIG